MTDIADPRTPRPLSGQDLAAFRQAIGLTQTALAQAADLSHHTVRRWEQKAVVDVEGSTFERLIAVLHRMKAPQVLDSLVQGLSAPEAEVALAVFETLGRWKDARALRPLVDALGHPIHARMAIQALGKRGDPGAIEPLRNVPRKAAGCPAQYRVQVAYNPVILSVAS